jgi:hypothetical protein
MSEYPQEFTSKTLYTAKCTWCHREYNVDIKAKDRVCPFCNCHAYTYNDRANLNYVKGEKK